MTEATTPLPLRRRVIVVAVVGTGALVALWLGNLTLSGAFFTDEATSPEQRIGTATVSVAADTAESSAPIDVAGFLPGDTATTTLTLDNDGTADVVWDLDVVLTADTDGDLADTLQVTIESDGRAAETMSLAAWATDTTERLTPQTAGASQELDITVSLPTSAGNELQGTLAAFTLDFTAQQARNR